MLKLTLADKKILSMIEYAPRITYKELATACHLSKDTIKYRIERLEREKIILQYTCYIDYKKLGNQSYKLYLKLRGDITQKTALKEYLRQQKNVFSIFEIVRDSSLGIAIFAKTHQEFNNIENKILEQFGHIITNRKFCTMIDVKIYQKNFFNETEKHTTKFQEDMLLWGTVENNVLDEKDKQLITILHKNSRTSLIDIGQKLKLSIDAIKNRIQRLNDKKIITIFMTNINYIKLGYDYYKLFIYPRVYSNIIESNMINSLKNTPNCINVVRTIGPWKIEAEFYAQKYQDMETILDQLNNKFKDDILDMELSIMRNSEIFACKELLLE